MTATGYRYIVKIPGVRSGNAIVEGTRIGVHNVVFEVLYGQPFEEILRDYPDLTRAQIYECMAYYEDHREEIDALIAVNAELP